jgi:hypothetical protein
MKSKIKKLIEESLKNYKIKTIKISNREYSLYIVPSLCDEDLNIFEGFLFAETESRSEVSYLKSKYKAPVSGYAPRIGLIFYDGHLLIKDYRRNRHIIKTLHKINKNFENKLKKTLTKPTEENFNKLFDRTDVIDEFYILFKKSREFLLKNISGIAEEEKREEFVDNFMMQMLTLWYLQEKGFFNNDTNYFITKFKELKQNKLFGNDFKSYYGFLTYFFEKISNNIGRQYYEDDKVGRVVVVGPAVFINGEQKEAISMPDKCFYNEGLTNILINTPPKKVSDDVPILNLFESRDWTEGNIDEFVLGAIFEKLMNYDERKKTGAYYTPEEITSYICRNTIEPYLVDKINEKFGKNFETIDQVIESNNKDIIIYLFEQLKEIKILDPAVGSGHFLESAINVLLSIYGKVWEKARVIGLKKGFTILASNEKGEIEEIELLSIKDEGKFHLLVKFFIILSKNIYGVDINPSALKVARARLFLTLAKHFKAGKEKDIFVRFPNVHFNLRAGNSLIGYVKPEKEKSGPITIFDFIKEEKADYIVEKIKVVAELKPYLEETAKNLKIDEDIVKEVETLNEILSKKSIDWDDFEKVLRTKEKLTRILIASLNSKYAVPLNELLREITDLFNQKLDEKFAEDHNIKLEDLKKIKTFHWFFEFPEAFLDRGGFDVVVGNPPYHSIDPKYKIATLTEHLILKEYKVYHGQADILVFFYERSFYISHKKGLIGLISKNRWQDSPTYEPFLYFLEGKHLKILDFDDTFVFIGVGVTTNIILIKKEKKGILEYYLFKNTSPTEILREDNYEKIFKNSSLRNIKYPLENEITEWIEKVGVQEVIYSGHGHKITPREFFEIQKVGKITFSPVAEKIRSKYPEINLTEKELKHVLPFISSGRIHSYYILNPMCIFYLRGSNLDDLPNIKKYFETIKPNNACENWYEFHCGKGYRNIELIERNKKIIFPSRQYIDRKNSFFLDLAGFLIGMDCEAAIPKDSSLSLKFLIVILNSSLIWYYFRRKFKRYVKRQTVNLEKTPIRILKDKQDNHYEFLSDYLLFLNATEERRQKYKETIEFFDRQIANSLVYELYFKEKFHEDNLYPKQKEYLLEAISKHLKPINYDRWVELYWRKQLEGSLTPEEEKELEEMEKKNIKVVEQVYNSIKGDSEVQKLIEKIKSHEWVKIIEEE